MGALFSGRIAGVTRAGLFVKLSETGADGFVPAGTLGDDYFRFEEANRAMVGTRTEETFRLGDEVKVRLVEAAPFAGALRFEIVRAGSEESQGSETGALCGAQADLQGQASMNDMSRFWRMPTPPPERSLREAMTRGFFGRCPACGRGRLFRSYLKVVNVCDICGEPLSGHRADDAPAYLTLLIVAHGVGAGILLSDETWPHSSLLWVAVFWVAVTLIASLLILPRAKGAIVGQQWALCMHGFAAHGDRM